MFRKFLKMTDVPVLNWEDADYLGEALPVPQGHSSDQGPSPWRQQSFVVAKGCRQPVVEMHVPMYGGTPSVRPAINNLNSLPCKGVRSAFSTPAAQSSASCLQSVHPGMGIVGNPYYSNIHSTLTSNSWPGEGQHFKGVMPMKTGDVVHVEQGCHYDFSTCPSTSYNCYTQVCHSVHHYPQPKRPRIDEKKLKAKTKSGFSKPGEITLQVSKRKQRAPIEVLPSPPPLIKKCEINKRLFYCEAPSKKKGYTTGAVLEPEHLPTAIRHECCKGGSKGKALQSAAGTLMNMADNRQTAQRESFVTGDSSALNIQSGQSFLSVGHKLCFDSSARLTQSNQREFDLQSRRTGSVVDMGRRFPRQRISDTITGKATEEESRRKCSLESLLVKPQKADSAVIQNGHFALSNGSQSGQNRRQSKKETSSRLDQQQLLSATPRNCIIRRRSSPNNETSMNFESAKYLSLSSGQHPDWRSESFRHRPQSHLKQSTPLTIGATHPRLQCFPSIKSNTQRGRSKSCDDTQSYTLNSRELGSMQLKPGCSSCRTQVMYSEKPREQGFKNKVAECNGVQSFNPMKRQYERSNSVIFPGTQESWNMQKDGDEMSSIGLCPGTRNTGVAQLGTGISKHTEPHGHERRVREQALEVDQTRLRTTLAPAIPTQQQSNINSEGRKEGKRGTNSPFKRQDQFLTDGCTRVPICKDRTENASSANQKSSSVEKPDNFCQTGTAYLMPQSQDAFNIGVFTTVNQLKKWRRGSSEDQSKFNNHSSIVVNDEKVSFSRNHPSDAQTRKPQEQRRGQPTQNHCNLIDTNRFEEYPDRPCDQHCKQRTRRLPSNEFTVIQCPHSREVTEELVQYQVDDSSFKRKLSTRIDEKIELPTHKVETSINAGESDQVTEDSRAQPTCHGQKTLPPLPSEGDLDSIGLDCGGYAIDHNTLPRIVAVHSIVPQDKGLKKGELEVVSAGDQKNWDSLLQKLSLNVNSLRQGHSQQSKLRKILTASCTNVLKAKSQVHPDGTSPTEKNFRSRETSMNDREVLSRARNWTLWDYLSSPSSELTIEVKGPTEYVEVVETEKKRQSERQSAPRKKLSVSELSKKITYTRERIKKESIPWKKKLLFRLEATFIKRLRKTEKETGVKADVIIDEHKVDEESTEENVEKEKFKKLGKRKNSATNARNRKPNNVRNDL